MPSPCLPLDEIVAAIDQELLDSHDGHELLRMTEPDLIERRPLQCDHPLDVLLGFTAPAHWCAIGLRCGGLATRPGGDGTLSRSRVTFTVLVDRDNRGAAALRDHDDVTVIDQPPEGLTGDACRRALSLPTPPPPSDTAELWLCTWLERVVDAIAFLGDAHRFRHWETVSALHPVGTEAPYEPVTLADATLQLATAWPWDRLRREPDVLDRPACMPNGVAAWMDDGMFARWVQTDMASFTTLAATLEDRLPDTVINRLAETTRAAGIPWPQGRDSAMNTYRMACLL